MSTKHTPGPWSHRNGRIFQTDRPELTIANVARAHDGDYSSANGDLLAASTELLDACKAAMQCIGELSPTQARVEVAQMLTAAIAKATGEQP